MAWGDLGKGLFFSDTCEIAICFSYLSWKSPSDIALGVCKSVSFAYLKFQRYHIIMRQTAETNITSGQKVYTMSLEHYQTNSVVIECFFQLLLLLYEQILKT